MPLNAGQTFSQARGKAPIMSNLNQTPVGKATNGRDMKTENQYIKKRTVILIHLSGNLKLTFKSAIYARYISCPFHGI